MGYHCPHQLWNPFQAPPPLLPLLQTSFDHLTSSENSALTAVYHRMKTNFMRKGNMMRFYEAHHLSRIIFLYDSIFFPRLLFCLVSGTSYNDHSRCEMKNEINTTIMAKNVFTFVMISKKEANDNDNEDDADKPLNKHADEVDENKLEESSKGESEADDIVDVQSSGVTHLPIGWLLQSSSS